jgi:nucleotide-binding universal stress UspA family protein
MKNILLAVDDTKGSKAAIPAFSRLFPCVRPENVILLYVERFEGRSLMTEMLPESELATLKEVLQGTEYKAALDKKADAILGYYRKALEEKGVTGIKVIKKIGSPSEEILNTAKEEKADMIIIGSRGKTVGNLFMGSVSREVANKAEIPVLLVK